MVLDDIMQGCKQWRTFQTKCREIIVWWYLAKCQHREQADENKTTFHLPNIQNKRLHQNTLLNTLYLHHKLPTLQHKELIDLLQQAYSAERAASFAYIGHARSVNDPNEKKAIKQIEDDEWHHRATVLKIMQQYEIPVSKYYEIRFYHQ